MANRQKYTAEQAIEALTKSGGVIAVAARALGCGRNTLYRYMEQHATVREAYDEANESNLDIAEAVLLEQVRGKDPQQLRFYLRTKGRARGYADRQEISGPDGGAIIVDLSAPRDP